jgi:hypothetical protein
VGLRIRKLTSMFMTIRSQEMTASILCDGSDSKYKSSSVQVYTHITMLVGTFTVLFCIVYI